VFAAFSALTARHNCDSLSVGPFSSTQRTDMTTSHFPLLATRPRLAVPGHGGLVAAFLDHLRDQHLSRTLPLHSHSGPARDTSCFGSTALPVGQFGAWHLSARVNRRGVFTLRPDRRGIEILVVTPVARVEGRNRPLPQSGALWMTRRCASARGVVKCNSVPRRAMLLASPAGSCHFLP
jgi:hypothetical protein